MATNNFYNHENGIYMIETVDFNQMKEWMLDDEYFEWYSEEDGDSPVWEQLDFENNEIVDNWLDNFRYEMREARPDIDIIQEDRYNARVYNKEGKLMASLEVVGGYYEGAQVIVETNPDNLEQYLGYFETKAELYEVYTPHHKRLLKELSKNTKALQLMGTFSNGEAVYSLA